MVSADSRRVSRAPRYSGARFESGSLSPTWLSHSMAPLSRGLRLAAGLVTLLLRVLQPPLHSTRTQVSLVGYRRRSVGPPVSAASSSYDLTACRVQWVWALPISLATTFGIEFLSFPPGTEMVHFPGFASPTYVFSRRYSEFIAVGFPIRKSPDQSLFAAPRSLSQLTTSFIASLCLGIHRTPLVA